MIIFLNSQSSLVTCSLSIYLGSAGEKTLMSVATGTASHEWAEWAKAPALSEKTASRRRRAGADSLGGGQH